MGRFAKELYDNESLWSKLPDSLYVGIVIAGEKTFKTWEKEKARKELLDCFYQLGGKNLYQ